MPKNTPQRRIDTRRRNQATSISGVTLSGPASVTDHGALLGLADDDHTQYLRADGSRQLIGNLPVTDGATVDGVDISAHAANADAHHATATAGNSGISVSGQAISLAAAAAGAGLTFAAGVLAVGAGAGLVVAADEVALTTPGTLTVATANNAEGSHTHAITSSADVTAGGTAILAAAAGNLKLATANVGSTLGFNGTFTSGFAGAGWRIDYGSTEAGKASATFDNLTIRGRMRVYEMLISQIRATNGSALISSTANTAQVVSTADDPLWTVNGSQLTFNGANATLETTIYTLSTSSTWVAVGNVGNDTGHYHGFLVGDLVRAQRTAWNGSTFAGVMRSDLEVTGVSDLYTYQGARVATGGDAPAMGYDFVRIGSASDTNRQGVVYLTSDDDNAPFIDVVNGVRAHSDWNTAGKVKARFGRLDGITDAVWGTLSGYGLWSDNVYLTGSIYARDGVFQGTVYASAGSFTGTVTAAAGTIGGWSIGATALTAGSGANTVGVDSGGTNPAFYAGSATPGSAPFRVTPAGALTASNATITGAITANSGSIEGFLTIGTAGGIYQGTGTSGTPTTGLKIFQASSIGQLSIYDGGTKTMRISNDDVRMLNATAFADIRTIKWLEDTDYSGTWSDLSSANVTYAYIGGYRTSTNAYLYLSNRVNNTGSPANTRHSQINLIASRNEGGTVYSKGLNLVTLNSTYSYDGMAHFAGMFLKLDAIATPTYGLTASSDAQVYLKGGKLIVRYNDGGTYRYKYLDLTGTGSSWTHTTTAP